MLAFSSRRVSQPPHRFQPSPFRPTLTRHSASPDYLTNHPHPPAHLLPAISVCRSRACKGFPSTPPAPLSTFRPLNEPASCLSASTFLRGRSVHPVTLHRRRPLLPSTAAGTVLPHFRFPTLNLPLSEPTTPLSALSPSSHRSGGGGGDEQRCRITARRRKRQPTYTYIYTYLST